MEKETDGKGTTKYKYNKCPVCGSKKRHYEAVSDKAIKTGTVEDGFLMPYQYEERVVVSPGKEKTLPAGTQAPQITSATEICVDCGCVYAAMVIVTKVEKGEPPPQPKAKLILPG